MKRRKGMTWILVGLAVVGSLACAQSARAAGPEANSAPAAQQAPGPDIGRGLAILGCAVGAAFAAAGGGLAIGKIGAACLESIARQPESTGQLFSPMIITAAMVEGCILFAIVIALLGILK
jgi:F-type H+-transporting ATPase subunit c